MADYQEIYEHHPDRYDELVAHEDHKGALRTLLDRILTPRPRLVVELGCGTGRVTRMLTTRAETVLAFDVASPMVAFAKAAIHDANVTFGVADNCALPVPAGTADAVVAGWTLGHVTGFYPDTWREHAIRALTEMRRCAAQTGKLVIIETLGTCVDTAAPPNQRLAEFYRLLEGEVGLRRTEIATDYAFPSLADAVRVMGFFFGTKMEQAVQQRGSSVVPEWTGVWTNLAS